jgi:membrane protease subunit HflK
VIIAGLAVIVLLSTSFFIVNPEEQALVLLLGKVKTTYDSEQKKEVPLIYQPGLHFKLPFGLEKNYNVLTQKVHKEEFGFRTDQPGKNTIYSAQDYPEESIMLTGDKNIVDVEWIIQYKIEDPIAWLFHVEEPEQTIRDISRSVINRLVGDQPILQLGSRRQMIETQAVELMNKLFTKYQLGINVNTVALQDILPPEGNVYDAFEDVNKAEQDRQRIINEGNEKYNKTVTEAQGQAQKMIEEAEGWATARINQANGDVARFRQVYEEYRKAPNVTKTRLYIEMYEDVFGKSPDTDLIDRNMKNFIPLKQLGETKTASRPEIKPQATEQQGGTQ